VGGGGAGEVEAAPQPQLLLLGWLEASERAQPDQEQQRGLPQHSLPDLSEGTDRGGGCAYPNRASYLNSNA
jgi:hypothetical protein